MARLTRTLAAGLCCGTLLFGCGEDKKAAPAAPPAPPAPSTSAATGGPSLAPKPEVIPAAPLSQEKTPPAAEATKPKPETPSAEVKPVEKPVAAPAAEGKWVNVTFGKSIKHTMDLPEAWKQEELINNMRLLQIRVPKHVDDAEDAQLLGFKFMAAGPVDQNIQRWVNQFGGGKDALVERKQLKTASGVEVDFALVQGTYTGMAPQAGGAEKLDPKPEYMMCGAIFTVADDGDYVFKFVGPRLTIEMQKDAFLKMIASFK